MSANISVMHGFSPRSEVRGLLAPFEAGWRAELVRRGYAYRTVADHMSLMAHLSCWLQDRDLAAAQLTTPVTVEFLRNRRDQGLSPMTARALSPLLEYLHGLQVVPDPAGRYPVTAVERLMEEYRTFLVDERGLIPKTAQQYINFAMVFLDELADRGGGVTSLTSEQVTGFLMRYCEGRTVGASKTMVVSLRALLRFLHLSGHTAVSLAPAVPSVPSWSVSPLPRGLERMHVAALLGCCDRESAMGRRDYAILMLLSRLGMRAGEVADLKLEDIDWQGSDLIIRGKGARIDQMPLPEDVGAAIADYLQYGRPVRSPSRNVFLTLRVPWSALAPTGVSAVVTHAGRRAGFARFGPHRLRHTVACDLLREGASLTEIGQLLRHRTQRTTAIYAKVDRGALEGLARTWPAAAK
jgi:integrase/recombinase XerD